MGKKKRKLHFFMVMEKKKKSKPKLGQADSSRNNKFCLHLIAAETLLIKTKLCFQKEVGGELCALPEVVTVRWRGFSKFGIRSLLWQLPP